MDEFSKYRRKEVRKGSMALLKGELLARMKREFQKETKSK